MIPSQNIIAWGNRAPWAEQRQIEQDLIISRVIIELFNDTYLRTQLRFRGGTALNKLHFPEPVRYSEDIDLVRTTRGEIKPILRRIRELLEPWLGRASFDRSSVAPKLRFQVEAEDGTAPLRLKVEINTRETNAFDEPRSFSHSADNPWFSGTAAVASFSHEEMLATKLRALLQRNKGRDLFDLSHALSVFSSLHEERVTEMFAQYLALQDQTVSRAEAEERMLAKLINPGFLADVRPLLTADAAERLTDGAMKSAFAMVFNRLISKIPGRPWARTPEFADRFELPLSS
ncbi:MAG: nucleotidyl transferase AbiEii/AbiGii toxin family protein [Pseudomonadales bacterium]